MLSTYAFYALPLLRDKLMDDYHQLYPQYGFSRHKGYGTAEHLQELERCGPCPIHRAGYGPVQDALEKKERRAF
jgi:ribonuclease HII